MRWWFDAHYTKVGVQALIDSGDLDETLCCSKYLTQPLVGWVYLVGKRWARFVN